MWNERNLIVILDNLEIWYKFFNFCHMISGPHKMQRKILVLPLFFVAVYASGEFNVLYSPPSLEFKGKDKLESDNVGDVIAASLGHSVQVNSHWSGLYLNDPFEVAKVAIVVHVDDAEHVHLFDKTKTFPLSGSSAGESLDILASTLEESNSQVLDVDLAQGSEALLTYSDILGYIEVPSNIKSNGSLKPDLHSEDKLFLQQLDILNSIADRLSVLQKKPSLITIRVSLGPIGTTHGRNSAAMAESLKMLSEAIQNFADIIKKTSDENLLFVVVASKSEVVRTKRQAGKADEFAHLNLATYYNKDYPVIFNIILWFGVVFTFSLLAICYAIATMDPGRDSIIYRMTSTRIKKDN